MWCGTVTALITLRNVFIRGRQLRWIFGIVTVLGSTLSFEPDTEQEVVKGY